MGSNWTKKDWGQLKRCLVEDWSLSSLSQILGKPLREIEVRAAWYLSSLFNRQDLRPLLGEKVETSLPERHGRKWSPSEELVLLEVLRRTKGLPLVSQTLQRTPEAVTSRLGQIVLRALPHLDDLQLQKIEKFLEVFAIGDPEESQASRVIELSGNKPSQYQKSRKNRYRYNLGERH